MVTTFQPQRQKATTRVPQNFARRATGVVSGPVIGALSGGALGGIAGGVSMASIVPSSRHNPTAGGATATAVGQISLGSVGALTFGGIGMGVGATLGTFSSAYGIVNSSRKGMANIFGRKTPDSKLVYRAIKSTFSFREIMQLALSDFVLLETLDAIKEQQPINELGKYNLAVRLIEGNRIDLVARNLGANDDNLEEAKTFIKDFIGLDDQIWERAERRDGPSLDGPVRFTRIIFPEVSELKHINDLTSEEKFEHKKLFTILSAHAENEQDLQCHISLSNIGENDNHHFIALKLKGGETYQIYRHDQLGQWLATGNASDPVTRIDLPVSKDQLAKNMILLDGIDIKDYKHNRTLSGRAYSARKLASSTARGDSGKGLSMRGAFSRVTETAKSGSLRELV